MERVCAPCWNIIYGLKTYIPVLTHQNPYFFFSPNFRSVILLIPHICFSDYKPAKMYVGIKSDLV